MAADNSGGERQEQDQDDLDQIGQSIQALLEFYKREELSLSRPQRMLERVSGQVSRPAYPALILVFVALWVSANVGLRLSDHREFDPFPYYVLQGILGLGSLLTATVVLATQHRVAGLAERRQHFELKVTLLIEQKTAKLIDLMEELRRDLPDVRNRHDPDAAALGQSVSPTLVRETLDERGRLEERANAAVVSGDDHRGDGTGNAGK